MSILEIAETLGNISEACRRGGCMDRTSSYEWKRRFQTHGLEDLKDMRPIPKSQPNTTTPETEAKIPKCSIAHSPGVVSSCQIFSSYRMYQSARQLFKES